MQPHHHQKLFDRYELQQHVFDTWLGPVWLARDTRLNLEVFVRFLERPEHFPAAKAAVGALAGISHPAVLSVIDFVADRDAAVIITDPVRGESLASVIEKKRPAVFEAPELSKWADQLLSLLHHLHQTEGRVHGGLRADHIWVDGAGDLRVADPGLINAICPPPQDPAQRAAYLGHLATVSPQRLHGESPGTGDDLYTFGALLYHCFTGSPVFDGTTILMQVENKLPPPVSARRQELGVGTQPVPQAWNDVLAECLGKDPSQRPMDAEMIRVRLAQAANTTTSRRRLALPGHVPVPKVSGRKIALAVAALLPLAAGWFGYRHFEKRLAGLEGKFAALEEKTPALLAGGGDFTARLRQAEDAAALWKKFRRECQSSPVPFTTADDDMANEATDQLEKISQLTAGLTTTLQLRREKLSSALAALNKPEKDLAAELKILQEKAAAQKDPAVRAEEQSSLNRDALKKWQDLKEETDSKMAELTREAAALDADAVSLAADALSKLQAPGRIKALEAAIAAEKAAVETWTAGKQAEWKALEDDADATTAAWDLWARKLQDFKDAAAKAAAEPPAPPPDAVPPPDGTPAPEAVKPPPPEPPPPPPDSKQLADLLGRIHSFAEKLSAEAPVGTKAAIAEFAGKAAQREEALRELPQRSGAQDVAKLLPPKPENPANPANPAAPPVAAPEKPWPLDQVFADLPEIAQCSGAKRGAILRKIQEKLRDLQPDEKLKLKPDGDTGPSTHREILAFQQRSSLPQDGKISAAVLEKLELKQEDLLALPEPKVASERKTPSRSRAKPQPWGKIKNNVQYWLSRDPREKAKWEAYERALEAWERSQE